MTPIVYLDRMQAGMVSAINTILGTSGAAVLWNPSEMPRDTRPGTAVSLAPLSGPVARGTTYEGKPQLHPTTITITLSGAAGRVHVGCTGATWFYDVASGENVSDARDALLALLGATGHRLYGTITPSGADAIQIVGDDLWSLYGLRVAGPASLVRDVEAFAKPTYTSTVLRVGLQVYSTTRYPSGGAMDTLAQITGSLERASICEGLEQHGITIAAAPTAPVDLTAIAGATWESRASASVEIRMISYIADALSTIQTVNQTINLKNAHGAQISATATATE